MGFGLYIPYMKWNNNPFMGYLNVIYKIIFSHILSHILYIISHRLSQTTSQNMILHGISEDGAPGMDSG